MGSGEWGPFQFAQLTRAQGRDDTEHQQRVSYVLYILLLADTQNFIDFYTEPYICYVHVRLVFPVRRMYKGEKRGEPMHPEQDR